jgi:gliding motility-associated-like protein
MATKFKLLILIMCFSSLVNAQNKSNRGKEFWLAYGFNYSFFHESPVNNQELAIYISTENAAAVVTITITNTGYTQTLNIPANTVNATILIPKSGVNDARTLTDGLQNKGIHIVSTEPVAVYAHVYSTLVSGATMLMPVETYGFSYYSINYYQDKSQSSPTDWYSWFYVIASEDNTRIQITPSDTTKNGWLPAQTYTVNLNKGESYHVFGKATFNGNPVFASKDMTGTKAVSIPGADGTCHPIAAFSGSGGIRLCRGDGGEFMHQQIFPTQAWGTRYLTFRTINNTNTNINETNRNYYRICVLDPTTEVKKNGVVMTGLIKNFFYEHMDSTGGDYFTSNKPMMIAQYTPNKNQCWNFPTTNPSPPSYGDPEMFYLSPIEQGQKSVLFYVSRKSSIDYVYANIHVPTAAIGSLRVNGNPVPSVNTVVHPNNPNYTVALTRFIGAASQHTITCDSAFTSTIYGLGNFESYGYNVGTLVNNLNYYSSIKNTFSSNSIDSFSCPKTPIKATIKLAFPASSIQWKLSQVTGVTPNTDISINNPISVGTETINGRNYYLYNLPQDISFANEGNYYIPVTYGATVIENCSQTENATVEVIIKAGPKADFTYTNAGCLKDTVNFTANISSAGFTINQYRWNFDDNTNVTTINAKKKFANAGTQNIRFRIYANNGCTGDTTKQITINHSPIAKLGIIATACSKDSVQITDTSSIAVGSITSWQYFFGDGNTLTKTNNNPFKYAYAIAGSYTIKLVTLSNSNCLSDTAFKTITINPKPTAKFGYNSNICIGDSIRFSDSSSIINGTITTRRWFLGDGQSVIRNNNTPFFYKYNAVGTYEVKLVVTSNLGCISDTFKLTVSVNNKPTASFTFNGKPCVDSIFTFTSSVTTSGTNKPTWYWSFGDGQIFSSTTNNVSTHAYSNNATNRIIKHIVSYGAACLSDTVTQTIPNIYANPTANFTIVGDTFCTQKNIQLIASNPNNILQWRWQLGSVINTSASPLTYQFNTAGNYDIQLTTTGNGGCNSTTFSRNIIIYEQPNIDAGINKIIINGTSTLLDASIANASLYNFSWTPATFLSAVTTLNPIATPVTNTVYTIKATHKTNFCSNIDSVKITVVNKLTIPNAFSPNGDNINDKWIIQGLELYPDAIVSIFTRGGQKLFERKFYSQTPWDGTHNGKPVPVGYYAYIIELNNSSKEKQAGMLLVIR